MDWKIKPMPRVIDVTPLDPETSEVPDTQSVVTPVQSGVMGLIAGVLLGWWLL
jgi:hypothetical protein